MRKGRSVQKNALKLSAFLPTIEKSFYLSFAGEEGFRGGCFLRSTSFEEALTKSHRLGINPGGEVEMVLFDESWIPAGTTVEFDRLLSLDDLEGF